MNDPKTILLVDDDCSLIDILSMSLQDAGFETGVAYDGREGFDLFVKSSPDLVILDLLMPEIDGLKLCQMIREKSSVPIVLLTSRDHEMDKILGLEMGADDYITKPFSTRELIARIQALFRRIELDRPSRSSPEIQEMGALKIDRGRREVCCGGRLMELTATEFDILWHLMAQAGVVMPRYALVEKVYGENIVVADRTIDTFIKRIRRKFNAINETFDPIETVRGVGYRFKDGTSP